MPEENVVNSLVIRELSPNPTPNETLPRVNQGGLQPGTVPIGTFFFRDYIFFLDYKYGVDYDEKESRPAPKCALEGSLGRTSFRCM